MSEEKEREVISKEKLQEHRKPKSKKPQNLSQQISVAINSLQQQIASLRVQMEALAADIKISEGDRNLLHNKISFNDRRIKDLQER